MKSITRQLLTGAFILVLVTVASLGIRKVRFSAHRAKAVEDSVIADTESDLIPAESLAIDSEPDPQYAEVPEPQEEAFVDDYPEPESLKGDYAKAKGSKGLEKVSLGDKENLYRTAEGELWYLGKGPDGKSFKIQVQIDGTTGEITGVGRVYGGKADGSQGMQKISIGGNDNIYITEEGQAWYVTDGYKAQVEIDDMTGSITVIEQHGDGDDK